MAKFVCYVGTMGLDDALANKRIKQAKEAVAESRIVADGDQIVFLRAERTSIETIYVPNGATMGNPKT